MPVPSVSRLKPTHLAIIIGVAVLSVTVLSQSIEAECANKQNGLISCSEVDFSAAIDKLVYEISERPSISVAGIPGKILGLVVLDGSGHQTLSDNITIGPNGTATYTFNASSYQHGIYLAILDDSTGKVVLYFPVALQSSGPVRFYTDRDHYSAGDTITVSGSTMPSKYVQILLIDPNLDIQYKSDTYSDSVGHFAFKLSLPQFVKSGYWRIRATSETNFMILPVPVGNTEDATDLMTPPPYAYKPGLPLQQIQSGISSSDVLCRPGLQLLVQSKQDLPACVRPQTAQKLIARGWTTVVYNPATAGTTTSLSALKMNLSTDNNVIRSGQQLGIDISLNNTSEIPLKVMAENSRPYSDLSLGEQCGRGPMGIAVLRGYYGEQNMSGGSALPVFPQYAVSCYAMLSEFSTKNYVFEPASSTAFVSTCNDGNKICGGLVHFSDHFEINGTWTGGKFQPFEPGTYTLIGGDEWGDVTIMHFTVEIMQPLNGNSKGIQNSNSTFRIIGGSGSGSFDSRLSPDYFNETELYTINVGKVIPGHPVRVMISDPDKTSTRTDIIPASSILPNGTFHYRINVTGKFGMDEYTIIFTYGNQSLKLVLPVVPPW